MMIDMKYIANCSRRQEYKTPAGMKYVCLPLARPEEMAVEEVIKHPEYFQRRRITLDDCKKCKKIDSKKLISKSKKCPPIATQINNYGLAIQRWVKAGRPQRTEEEVQEIFKKHCGQCNWYANKRCKGCGCRVTSRGMAIFNKIKMATEHCPKKLW